MEQSILNEKQYTDIFETIINDKQIIIKMSQSDITFKISEIDNYVYYEAYLNENQINNNIKVKQLFNIIKNNFENKTNTNFNEFLNVDNILILDIHFENDFFSFNQSIQFTKIESTSDIIIENLKKEIKELKNKLEILNKNIYQCPKDSIIQPVFKPIDEKEVEKEFKWFLNWLAKEISKKKNEQLLKANFIASDGNKGPTVHYKGNNMSLYDAISLMCDDCQQYNTTAKWCDFHNPEYSGYTGFITYNGFPYKLVWYLNKRNICIGSAAKQTSGHILKWSDVKRLYYWSIKDE